MIPNSWNHLQDIWGMVPLLPAVQDLLDQFSRVKNELDGLKVFMRSLSSVSIALVAAKAKPKAILKMMETKGLTIVQVKSHLQKYRSDKYMSECNQAKPTINDMPQLVFSSRISMGIKEVQQLQLDIEKDLHEQLEIQRNLQLQNEENGRQLKLMLEQQQKTNKSLP
eukprot:XP_024443219.1 myb family transcription factor PHL5 isoform X6 [Populus trichocarpa]